MQNGWIQDEGIDDRAHLVEIGGELDIASASQLKDLFERLIAAGKRESSWTWHKLSSSTRRLSGC